MLEINTSFDDSQAQALLSIWMTDLGHSMHDAVIRAGRVAARGFGESTWPKDQKQFERSIDAQINRVYASRSQAYEAIKDTGDESAADAFWYFINLGGKIGMNRARIILQQHGGKMSGVPIQKFDGGTAHMAIKRNNQRGRIGRNVKPRMIVLNDGANAKGQTPLGKYIAKKQALIGLTQSAWYNCLQALGGRNRRSKSQGMTRDGTEVTKPFPKWVQRHKGKGFGKVSFSDEPDRYGVVLHNNVRWSAKALEAGAERYIMAKAREHLIKSMILDLHYMKNPRQ